MLQSAVVLSNICLQQRFKVFVTDVKCSQATWQTVPKSRTGRSKASVFEAVVRTWHGTPHKYGQPWPTIVQESLANANVKRATAVHV